jgi:hypothetical protein
VSRHLADEEVLAAVVELSNHYHGPSTSLITWQLAGGDVATSAFQTSVRNALQRLRAGGQLSCVMHRGTHRWGAAPDGERP